MVRAYYHQTELKAATVDDSSDVHMFKQRWKTYELPLPVSCTNRQFNGPFAKDMKEFKR